MENSEHNPASEPTQTIKVVVHPAVDLDACACVAFAGVEPEEVGFLPAHVQELPPEWKEARVLDHPLGQKGTQNADGTVQAAAVEMPEASALRGSALLAEIEVQDRFGGAVPHFSLAQIVAATRCYFETQGLEGDALDRAVLRTMLPILRGLAQLTIRLRESELASIRIGPWVFAIRDQISEQSHLAPEDQVPTAGEGPVGVLFHDKHGLGVCRLPGYREPDLRKLRPYLPGWFIHPAGFLACWGTRKAPRPERPPVETPQNIAQLIAVLKQALVQG